MILQPFQGLHNPSKGWRIALIVLRRVEESYGIVNPSKDCEILRCNPWKYLNPSNDHKCNPSTLSRIMNLFLQTFQYVLISSNNGIVCGHQPFSSEHRWFLLIDFRTSRHLFVSKEKQDLRSSDDEKNCVAIIFLIRRATFLELVDDCYFFSIPLF